MFIYYRFMVCFPIELDFLFIIFLLHFFLSWGIFLVDLMFCHIRFYTLQLCPSWSSNWPSAFNSKLHTFLHPTILTNQLSQLSTCPSVFHLIIGISALSNFNPTSTSKGLVSLPKVMLLLTQLTNTRLQRGSTRCQKWKTPSELHPSISDSSCSSNIGSISTKSVPWIAKTRYTSIYLSFHH